MHSFLHLLGDASKHFFYFLLIVPPICLLVLPEVLYTTQTIKQDCPVQYGFYKGKGRNKKFVMRDAVLPAGTKVTVNFFTSPPWLQEENEIRHIHTKVTDISDGENGFRQLNPGKKFPSNLFAAGQNDLRDKCGLSLPLWGLF